MGLPSIFFARPDDQKRIDFKDGPLAGYWISIRRRVSDAEQKRLTLSMFKGMGMKDGKPSSMEADATMMDTQKLRLWVMKWGKDGEPGTRPTGQELQLILPPHAAQILAAIAAHEEDLALEDDLDVDPLPASGEPTPSTGDGEFMTLELDGSTLP